MKKAMIAGVVIAVLFGAYFGISAIFTKSYHIPTAKVQQGEFIIALNENGTVDAVRAVTLSAPRVRGLQVTWLAPEGQLVEEGDPVIKFDASQQQAEFAERTSDLKIKEAALVRAQKEHTIQEKQLLLELQKARRNYDEKKHDADRIAEEARMELELSELNFDARLEQLKGDVQKAEVEVDRARDRLELAEKELAQTTINAPIPGLVVYLEIWKGGTMGKVQEGDSPWPGQGLVNLPDLTAMKVKTTVSEVDANKVDSGQEVIITLDAFPDLEYMGTISSKATLARKKDYGSLINVFDIEVALTDHDDNFKPGMSAACQIVVERRSDIVSVPFEAVFEIDGSTVVYMKNKKEREVVVGQKNDMTVEIIEGLQADEEVCLVNPTLDELGLPGDRATEPEMNKDRTKKPGKGSGRRSKRGS